MNVLTITMRGISMSKMKEVYRLIEEDNFEELSMMLGVKLAKEYFDKFGYKENVYDS